LDFRILRNSPPTIGGPERPQPHEADGADGAVHRDGENDGVDADQNNAVDLGRLAWLATVGACLIAVLVLLLQGYYGYAAVTFAVALAAGINLL
jgi:hypothetical protein